MPLIKIDYDREQAVEYAHKWAYKRNPQYYDFSNIGGDCTNYASQCLYEGCKIMNFTPTFGWYYISVDDRAPAWTSVEYLYRFLTTNEGAGPFAKDVLMSEVMPGDLVQIKFNGKSLFGHTPVILSANNAKNINDIYISAHSSDCDCRPLSTYQNVNEMRFLHIVGARQEERE